MGVGDNFGEAFAKAQLGAGTPLPESVTLESVTDVIAASATAHVGTGTMPSGELATPNWKRCGTTPVIASRTSRRSSTKSPMPRSAQIGALSFRSLQNRS